MLVGPLVKPKPEGENGKVGTGIISGGVKLSGSIGAGW